MGVVDALEDTADGIRAIIQIIAGLIALGFILYIAYLFAKVLGYL